MYTDDYIRPIYFLQKHFEVQKDITCNCWYFGISLSVTESCVWNQASDSLTILKPSSRCYIVNFFDSFSLVTLSFESSPNLSVLSTLIFVSSCECHSSRRILHNYSMLTFQMLSFQLQIHSFIPVSYTHLLKNK